MGSEAMARMRSQAIRRFRPQMRRMERLGRRMGAKYLHRMERRSLPKFLTSLLAPLSHMMEGFSRKKLATPKATTVAWYVLGGLTAVLAYRQLRRHQGSA
jgi:hypothetical protein